MPLYFTDKKRHWPPSKPVQYIFAITLLLIAIAVLIGWLLIRFAYTEDPQTDKPVKDTTAISEEDLPNTGYCLVVIEDVDCEQFALVKTEPQKQSISITALSADMQTNEGTLRSQLRKFGPAQTAQSVAKTMNLPNLHYVSFSIADVEILFTRLGENLLFTIPEEVTYQDENGATIRLPAEERKLTPGQIASLLRHTHWKDKANQTNLAANITTALFNQCLLPNKSLKGYFELIANASVTDLRIDQFNAYQIGWAYLASLNHGAIAQRTETITH